jgi:hypothetical protein
MSTESNPTRPIKREQLEKRLPGFMLTVAEVVLLGLMMIIGGNALLVIFADGFAQIDFQWIAKIVLVFLFFVVGWVCGLIAVRHYHNKYALFMSRFFIWLMLLGIMMLYAIVMFKFFTKHNEPVDWRFFKFLVYTGIIGGALVALIGLALIPPQDGDMKLFGWILFAECLVHAIVVAVRYAFVPDPNANMLGFDLLMMAMLFSYSLLAIAHRGLLKGIRKSLNDSFAQWQKNSPRPQ